MSDASGATLIVIRVQKKYGKIKREYGKLYIACHVVVPFKRSVQLKEIADMLLNKLLQYIKEQADPRPR